MLKLTKKQLKELAINLDAKEVGFLPNEARGCRNIAYSWNETNGFVSGAIFWSVSGEICCTLGVRK